MDLPTSGPTSCPLCPTMPSFPKKKLSIGKQLYFSFLGSLIFMLISLPLVYDLTDSLFGKIGLHTQTQYGCPSYTGLVIHFLVYFLFIFGLMKLFEYLDKDDKDSKERYR